MKLSYAKMRKVLAILAKNDQVKEALANIGKGDGNITPLGFIGVLEESEIDIQILEIISAKGADEIDTIEAVEAFTGFFMVIKESWQKLAPLLPSSTSPVVEKAKSTL